METWIWLLMVERFFSSTCPFTSKIGSTFGLITVPAVIVFCVLCFFFAERGWIYGVIAFAIYFLVPLFIPKIDTNEAMYSKAFCIYSGIFSHLTLPIVVLMYLSLFKVI